MRTEDEMKIKSYYSRTVEDAMAAARQEMGPDAMLVNSRKAPPEVRHLGEYEVVFANVAGAVAPAEATLRLPGERSEAIPVSQAPANNRLSTEVAELKKELEGMRHAITRTAYAPAQWIGVSRDLSDAYAMLTAAELSAEVGREILPICWRGCGTPSRARPTLRRSGSASRGTCPTPMPCSPPLSCRRSWPARLCRPRWTE